MPAQDGLRTERLPAHELPSRRGVGLDLARQPGHQIPIPLRTEVTPAGQLREHDCLLRRKALRLGVLLPPLSWPSTRAIITQSRSGSPPAGDEGGRHVELENDEVRVLRITYGAHEMATLL